MDKRSFLSSLLPDVRFLRVLAGSLPHGISMLCGQFTGSAITGTLAEDVSPKLAVVEVFGILTASEIQIFSSHFSFLFIMFISISLKVKFAP